MKAVLDWRKQRIFAALEGKSTVDLDDLSTAAEVTRQLAARELKRLAWKRQHDGKYCRP